MKISNLFILTGAMIIGGLFIASNFINQKFLTREEFDRNFNENKSSFDQNLYNYKSTAFEQSFDEVLIVDTTGRPHPTDQRQWPVIQFIPSEHHGMKHEAYSDYGDSYKIEKGKLILYHNKTFGASRLLLVYAPRIKRITVQKAAVRIEALQADSITLEVNNAGKLHLDNTLSSIRLLANQGYCTIRSTDTALATVDAKLLNGSFIGLQADSCASFIIHADTSSSAKFGPPLKQQNEPMASLAHVGLVRYNSAIKELKLSYCQALHVQGDPQKLALDMPYEQVKENLAVMAH